MERGSGRVVGPERTPLTMKTKMQGVDIQVRGVRAIWAVDPEATRISLECQIAGGIKEKVRFWR